jgi:hypothetical protein
MKSDDKAMVLCLAAFLMLCLGGFAVGGWIDTHSENVEKEKFIACIQSGKVYEDGNCK